MRSVALKIFLLTLLCAVTASCAGTVRTAEPAMPAVFLGDWLHEEERFRLTVYPDGTMKDVYIETGELVAEYRYKILQVYNPERAAIVFKARTFYENTGDRWWPPEFSFLYINHPPAYFKDILVPKFHWGSGCRIISEKQWRDIERHRQEIMDRLKTIHPDSPCISGTLKDKYWRSRNG